MDNEQREKMRVLAIEDEETSVTLYRNVLTPLGHALDVASTGAEAVAAIEGQTYDLILLDLKLPDSDGIDVLKQIKDQITWTPVIIITAHPSLDSSIEAIRTGGVYEYLIKPFGHQQLVDTVRRAVDKAQLTLENHRLLKKLERTNQALTERVDQLERFARLAVDYEKKIWELKEKVRGLEQKLKNSKR